MKAKNEVIDMPPVEWGMYLISYLYEFGPAAQAGMGTGPVSFVEMEAWARLACVDLQPWEARMLRRLSTAYVVMAREATDIHCRPPYGESAALKRSQDREAARQLKLFLS